MRRSVLTLAAAFVALIVAAGAGGPARAVADHVVTGVWWRAQSDGGTLPAPPNVSSHQLWVSSDASGPSAVSALRLGLSGTEVASTLTLHVASLTAAPGTPAEPMQVPVLVCPTTAPWTPVDASTPGAWNAQPHYDCTKGQVQGAFSADQKTLTFDLTPIAVPGAALDVAVVPGTASNPVPQPPPALPAPSPVPANASPTFDVTFNPPAPGDVAVSGSDAAASDDLGEALGGSVSDVPATSPLPADVVPFVPPSGAAGAPLGSTSGVENPLGPPPASLDQRIQPAVLATNKRSGTRVLAGVVFLALCAWAWQQFSLDARTASSAGAGRPRLSLYDVPAAPPTRVTARHFTHTERTGRPPPLR